MLVRRSIHPSNSSASPHILACVGGAVAQISEIIADSNNSSTCDSLGVHIFVTSYVPLNSAVWIENFTYLPTGDIWSSKCRPKRAPECRPQFFPSLSNSFCESLSSVNLYLFPISYNSSLRRQAGTVYYQSVARSICFTTFQGRHATEPNNKTKYLPPETCADICFLDYSMFAFVYAFCFDHKIHTQNQSQKTKKTTRTHDAKIFGLPKCAYIRHVRRYSFPSPFSRVSCLCNSIFAVLLCCLMILDSVSYCLSFGWLIVWLVGWLGGRFGWLQTFAGSLHIFHVHSTRSQQSLHQISSAIKR